MKLDARKYHRSKPVRPVQIVLMLVLLNALLGFLVMLFPKGVQGFSFDDKVPFVHWTDDIDEADVSLQFVSATDLFTEKDRTVVDVDSVLADIEVSDTSFQDTVTTDTSFDEPEPERKLQYANDVRGAMDQFYASLAGVENGTESLIRILHYGDSQLEGDRISDYLRNKMQNRFGGHGPGIVLPVDISRARVSIRQSESADWKKYAIYTKQKLTNGHYGIGGSAYRYTGTYAKKVGEDTIVSKRYDSLVMVVNERLPVEKKSLEIDSAESISYDTTYVPFDTSAYVFDTVIEPRYVTEKSAYSWLRYRCAKRSYARVRTFSHVSMMYSSTDSVRCSVVVDGSTVQKLLPPRPFGGMISLYTGQVSSEVQLKFNGPSPTVWGVLLDGETGVAVDNFPMRGSSGTGYATINRSVYSKQMTLVNAKLVVMQYGINVVPNPVKSYKFYERMFSSELRAIKAANPDISILVIGPSDMSRKRAGEYESYPNIEKIRDAMRNAAFDNGCAFWDLYTAMGGKNSMVSWVQNEPALASKDYTHFNSRGARYIGEMLYNAIMSDYAAWKLAQ